MASVINTNISSLNAQRNLTASQGSLATSLQRLSSGLRINSAKDDAAGLAISDRMNSQIRGMNQAVRNANDGVSLAQTAEGALASSGDILQRIRELAVQSSNATNSSSDRQALQTEVGQLASELNRVAQTTNFNGQNLLDGTMGTATFQVGADANQTIKATGANFLTNTYGDNRVALDEMSAKLTSSNAANGSFTINGVRGTSGPIATTTSSSAGAIAAQINATTDKTGVTATAKTETFLQLGNNEAYTLDVNGDNSTAINISFTQGGGQTSADYAAGINAFNAQSSKTGITAEYDATNKGIKLTSSTGADIKLKNVTGTANGVLNEQTYLADSKTLDATVLDIKGVNAVGFANGRVTMDSESSFSVVEGTDTGYNLQGSSVLKSVANLDVTTFDGAQLAIKIADAALSSVNNQRAAFGALQSRFSSTISNLSTTTENLSASRSRIVDTDFAAETASLTRGQILQQAGTAMLAQANSLPNGVLSLLRG